MAWAAGQPASRPGGQPASRPGLSVRASEQDTPLAEDGEGWRMMPLGVPKALLGRREEKVERKRRIKGRALAREARVRWIGQDKAAIL